MQKATYEGIIERNTEMAGTKSKAVRPFILTRSSFIGGQKYGAIWTGDNMTSMLELQGSLHMVLSSGLVGQAFIGADTPGFLGRPSEAMFVASY